MHQRDQRMGRLQFLGRIRQHAERETVDHDRPALRHVGEMRLRGRARERGGMRKTLAEVEYLRPPAKLTQFGDHAAIIGIAAGRRIEVARDRKDEITFHKGASYQARAFGNSPTVTRIAEISFAGRPSLFAFTAAANWSNTQRVSHSVVVLTPLNSAMSSRFL